MTQSLDTPAPILECDHLRNGGAATRLHGDELPNWCSMSRRRPLALLAAVTITLAACGSESASEPAAEPTAATTEAATPAPTEAPAATPAPEPAAEPAAEPAEPETTAAPAPEPTEAPAPEATEAPAPEPTEAPTPEPVGIVDGCATDGSPTLVESAAGPAPAIDIRPESADGPLIDLAVRRINCAGGWANLRNEVPSDRPILIWFWAPH